MRAMVWSDSAPFRRKLIVFRYKRIMVHGLEATRYLFSRRSRRPGAGTGLGIASHLMVGSFQPAHPREHLGSGRANGTTLGGGEMGWAKGESIIEQRREQISAAPRGTILALQEDLRRVDLRPRERARLLGLLVACHRHVREWENAESVLVGARSIPRVGKIAKVELVGHEAMLRIDQAREGEITWERALETSIDFLSHTEDLPRLKPSTDWGRRQERCRRGLHVAALVARGEVSLKTGDIDTALRYGITAMGEVPSYPKSGPVPAFAQRIPKGPLSLVATALVRGSSGEALNRAKTMIEALIDDLPGTEKLARSGFSALLGCIAARQGNFDQAAEIFEKALDTLSSIGADGAHSQVLAMWEWSVRHIEDQARRIEDYLSWQRKLPPLG